MGDVLLSASMIVRNEEHHIEACLLSIRDLVDEAVVVDTGSTDASRDIARRLGARVYDFEWCDDFSAARNKALRLSRGEWILYIDADERLRPTPRARLEMLLKNPSLIGCYVLLHARAGYLPYRELRLFRNDTCLRFEGAMHENIWPAITRCIRAQGGEIGHSEIVLDHLGYDGPQDHKHRRNLPLLLKKVKEDPDHIYSWWHLGAVYKGLGDLERAREAWRSGIAAARRAGATQWADSLPFVELVQLDLHKPGEADSLLEEAMRRYPDHAHLVWLHGQELMRDRRFEEALPVFRHLADWRATPHESDGALGYDERLFAALAYEGLATCNFRLGCYGEAERWFALAEECEPHRLEYRVKHRLCAALAPRGGPGAARPGGGLQGSCIGDEQIPPRPCREPAP